MNVLNKKTIKQYFEELPDDIKPLALKNLDVDPNKKCDSMFEALDYGFDWEESPEGIEFWENIWRQYYTKQ